MATVGGLFWYEIVLLVLGAVFFLVLLGALRSALGAGKSYVGLLPFFLVSIAMMGYPSITSIQYKDGMVEIENDTNQIANDPGNPQITVRRQALEAKLDKLAPRATGGDAQAITRARDLLNPQSLGAKPGNGEIRKGASNHEPPSHKPSSSNLKPGRNK